jgi:hypothetical protein
MHAYATAATAALRAELDALRRDATADPVIQSGWKIESMEPWAALTEEINADSRWRVMRTEPPFCSPDGTRAWLGPTIAEAFRRADAAMKETP